MICSFVTLLTFWKPRVDKVERSLGRFTGQQKLKSKNQNHPKHNLNTQWWYLVFIFSRCTLACFGIGHNFENDQWVDVNILFHELVRVRLSPLVMFIRTNMPTPSAYRLKLQNYFREYQEILLLLHVVSPIILKMAILKITDARLNSGKLLRPPWCDNVYMCAHWTCGATAPFAWHEF